MQKLSKKVSCSRDKRKIKLSLRSSAVEQCFRKAKIAGSNPAEGFLKHLYTS